LFCFAAVFLYKTYLKEEITSNVEYVGHSLNDPSTSCNGEDICNSNSTDVCYREEFICEETALESFLLPLVSGMFGISMLSFGLFLLSINREYLWTFFDMRTGKQFAVDTYHSSETDSSRFEIFGHHETYYSSVAEELMTWLNDNWEKWEEEKPEWFTAVAISTVPQDMLPVRVKNKLGGTKEERRNSLNKQIVEEAKAKEERERAKREGEVVPVS
jgi:hypothetical protein